MISFNDFEKLDLRIGKVLDAESVEGSDKLIRIELDLGSVDNEQEGPKWRQVVSGIGDVYDPKDLIGKYVVLVANLKPRMLMGFESQGMILAASDEKGKLSLLTTMEDVEPGAEVS